MSVEEVVKRAISDFNKRFATELEPLKVSESEIIIHFKGHICFTCGTYDYFEDLAYHLSDLLNKEYVVERYEQQDDGSYIVYYKPKEKVKERKREIVVYFIEYRQPNKKGFSSSDR